jgi:raffinose/stachyose/melibiose transport system permease protein
MAVLGGNIKKMISRTVMYGVLLFFTIYGFFAVYFSLITALKTSDEYYFNKLGLPLQATLENLVFAVKDAGVLEYIGNTLFLLPGEMLLFFFLVLTASFAFAHLDFPFRRQLFLVNLFLMIFPPLLLIFTLVKTASSLGIINSYHGIVTVWAFYFAPYGVYLMTSFFAKVPKTIIEAARIDGAGTFRILFTIMVPISKPMIATLVVINFQQVWNDLVFPMVLLTGDKLRPLTVAIATLQGQYGLPVNKFAAFVVVSAVIPAVIWILLQRLFSMGAVEGSVKG